MVDSRAKGMRGEYLVRDMLREYTNLQFERIPASGALAYLKGDLWVPNQRNNFCIEVKSYATTPFCDKIFTQERTNKLTGWWKKLLEQKGEQDPLLFFKYNRSRIYVVTDKRPDNVDKYIHISWLEGYLMLAEDWLEGEKVEWIK